MLDCWLSFWGKNQMRPSMIPLLGRNPALIFSLAILSSMFCGAQTFKTLVVFNGTNGDRPVDTPLVQGTDGNLYGTTLGGGAYGSGTIFKMGTNGRLTTIYSFCSQPNCADGSLPYGGLVLASDGDFYGTTNQGGSNGVSGTVFKVTPGGKLTTLHNFSGSDGAGPLSPLIQGTNGMVYGITENGGSSNAGTFFSITLGGKFTSLYSFSGPTYLTAPLTQASDGNFYSTSELGGANGYGMVFKLTASGVYTVVHSFNSSDGSSPASGLLQALDGNLYGTTYEGGSGTSCPNGCGTVFKLSSTGTLTTLHDFIGADGSNPIAALIQATDGNFYGTTYGGGNSGWGTVYGMSPSGSVVVLHSFAGGDGAQPYAPVSQDTNGTFYGTATYGIGGAADGTTFELSTGLSPFVSFLRNSGKVGQTIGIFGQGLTGTTAVSFGSATATFQIRSDAFLTAVVPAGAQTGFVEVTTASRFLKSNVPFRVVP